MSHILSEQLKVDDHWEMKDREYETKEEAEFIGACDLVAGDCKYYEVYHS